MSWRAWEGRWAESCWHGEPAGGFHGSGMGWRKQSVGDFLETQRHPKKGKGRGYACLRGQARRGLGWALSDYLRSLSFGPAAGGAVAQVTPVPSGTAGAGTAGTGRLEPPLPHPPRLHPRTTGKISGVVTNTTGGDIPSGSEGTLHGFDNMQAVITQTTTVAADGTYTFENVEMPANRSFLTTVGYKGTTYGSEIGVVQSGSQELNLPIQVYETTTDQSVLNVDRLHMFLNSLREYYRGGAALYHIEPQRQNPRASPGWRNNRQL